MDWELLLIVAAAFLGPIVGAAAGTWVSLKLIEKGIWGRG